MFGQNTMHITPSVSPSVLSNTGSNFLDYRYWLSFWLLKNFNPAFLQKKEIGLQHGASKKQFKKHHS